jgi:hypothetical protein
MSMMVRWLAGATALAAWFCTPALHAGGQEQVRKLPVTQEVQQKRFVSQEGKDYVLRQRVVRTDAVSGEKMSVTLIDVLTGAGDWDRPDAARLPPVDMVVPASVRRRLYWFYDGVIGWMPVPSGWRLQYAASGADGNTSYTFVAPGGAVSGWLAYGVIPACLSCLLGAADGLLPGAYEQEVANGYVHGVGPLPLQPVPDVLEHPDECTALLRYRADPLIARAAVLSSQPLARPKGDLSEADVFVALPAEQATLAEAIIGNFRHHFAACHAPGGWPG